MAGKTIPGIGDDPPLDPADAADSGASGGDYYSGPTVVDDAKVEMGLQKLRSLDAPPGPMTGITKAVVDAIEIESGRAQVEATPIIPEITVDSGRETAVGRSVVGPVSGQQTTTPAFDDKHLRGTMFGHGVHLPEIELPPRPVAPQPVSRALAVIDRGAPTHNAVAVFHQPPPRYTNGEPPPPYAKTAPLRSSRFQNTPYDVPVPEMSRGKKIATRIATALVGIAAFAGAAMIWLRTSGDDDPVVRPAPAVRLPPVQVERPAPPPAPATPPPAAPVVAPAAVEVAAPPKELPRPVADKGADEQDSPATAPPSSSRHTRSSSSHAEHHHAAKTGDGPGAAAPATPAEKPDKPEKPARATKRATEEDPDATMAPTIE